MVARHDWVGARIFLQAVSAGCFYRLFLQDVSASRLLASEWRRTSDVLAYAPRLTNDFLLSTNQRKPLLIVSLEHIRVRTIMQQRTAAQQRLSAGGNSIKTMRKGGCRHQHHHPVFAADRPMAQQPIKAVSFTYLARDSMHMLKMAPP